METKTKHLEFIQSAIARMANNSFLLKGWTITLVGALLALSFKELDRLYVGISALILIWFWLLDSYYLSRERLFIKLYDHVRNVAGTQTDFSMDTRSFRHGSNWLRCAFSTTMILFYGGLFVAHAVVLIILLRGN